MSAYYGVKASAPLAVVGTATTANNTTSVVAPAITMTTNDALVLAFFSSNTNPPTRRRPACPSATRSGPPGAVSVAPLHDMTQPSRVDGRQDVDCDNVRARRRSPGLVPRGRWRSDRQPHQPRLPLAGTVSLVGNAADTRLGGRQRPVPALAGRRRDVDEHRRGGYDDSICRLLRHDRGRRRALQASAS